MRAINLDQKEFWNGPRGESWVSGQAQMDRFLHPFTEELLRRARPARGERVLDVGCGTGETSLLVAEAVGEGGAVLGVDISQPMLDLARNRAMAAGAQRAAFALKDAQVEDLGPEADLVMSRFGVMFFEDPAAGFANMRRHARPGARLCFVCWQPVRENEWVTVGLAAAKQHVAFPPPPDPYAPGPFALADMDRTLGLLAQAGWREAAGEPFRVEISQGGSAEQAAENLMLRGPISRAMAEATQAQIDAVRRDLTAALTARAGTDDVKLGAAVWFVTARND